MTVASSNCPVTAQTTAKDDVTLVVLGDGQTEGDATKEALRNAISKVYGTFVSANTTLLSDESAKEEIITKADGTYNEIVNVNLTNGTKRSFVKATISIPSLVSYAKSKGASTEFAGAAFARSMKIKDLKKQAELEVLNGLLSTVKDIMPLCFNRTLTIEEPTEASKKIINDKFKDITWGDLAGSVAGSYTGTYRIPVRLRKPDHEKKFKEMQANVNSWLNKSEGAYWMTFKINYDENQNTKPFFHILETTMKNLSLTDEEKNDYQAHNSHITKLTFGRQGFSATYIDNDLQYYLRNSDEDIIKWTHDLSNVFYSYFTNFGIKDNTNITSYISKDYSEICMKLTNNIHYSSVGQHVYFRNYNLFVVPISEYNEYSRYFFTKGSGIFAPYVIIQDNLLHHFSYWNFEKPEFTYPTNGSSMELYFLIPRDDISKYSGFNIVDRY